MALKTVTNNNVTVSSINSEKGIIYGVVYRPELVDSYNETFSQSRAESVVQYLIAKGIDASRLVAKGYGESKPTVPNNSEKNKQINRRVEFTILKV